jgi:hypothetical protein
MKHLFCTLFLFNSILVFSQSKKNPDTFEEAYMVMPKGDTLRGAIKIPKIKKSELYQKISFKDKANKIRLYTPDKINGYNLNNYYYISAYHNDRPCFFKVLSKGKASLFQIVFEEVHEGIVYEINEFCVLEEKSDGQFKVIDEKNVKKQLKDFFKSNKLLVQKISEQKEILLNAEKLETYFVEFNQTALTN